MKAAIAILLSMLFGTPTLAATFVYVSNADDGEIGAVRDRSPQQSASSDPSAKSGGIIQRESNNQVRFHTIRVKNPNTC
jgi:hypothetical protein